MAGTAVDKKLSSDIVVQSTKLVGIQEDVNKIILSFTEASSRAVRLGDRLSAADSERKCVDW